MDCLDPEIFARVVWSGRRLWECNKVRAFDQQEQIASRTPCVRVSVCSDSCFRDLHAATHTPQIGPDALCVSANFVELLLFSVQSLKLSYFQVFDDQRSRRGVRGQFHRFAEEQRVWCLEFN